MRERSGRWAGFGLAIALGALAGWPAAALADLAARIAAAPPGSTLQLEPGVHRGPVVVDRTLTLVGGEGVVIEGDGASSVITVDAPDVALRGLTVRGSGLSLTEMHAGIVLTDEATGARVEANRLENNLIGVHIDGAAGALVRGNTILGRQDLRLNERGNGVYLWNAPGARVEDNNIRHGRDGIFTTTSRNNRFTGNRFEDLRFAVHYMYTNDSVVADNESVGNHVGYALMYSDRIRVLGNRSQSARDHGLLFNYANHATVRGNEVVGGGEKCVFIYNSNFGRFEANRFQGCGIGIHFTAGSERNVMVDNAFIGNRTQVKYVGTRRLVWSEAGRGNYWSDHASFDLDGDGIADQAYHPNDLVDQAMWRAPQAKLLLSSPAVQLLRWAQSAFPALRPGGVVDVAPLMRPPQSGSSRTGEPRS